MFRLSDKCVHLDIFSVVVSSGIQSVLDPQCIDDIYVQIWQMTSFSFFSATIGIALPGMDREIRDEYMVVIQAKDMGGHMGGLSGTTTVTVRLTDVNDNPPKFAKSG